MSIGLTPRTGRRGRGEHRRVADLEQGRTRCPRWGAVTLMAAALDMDRHERAELVSAWSDTQPDRDVGYAAMEAEDWTCGPDVRIGVLGPLTAMRAGAAVGLGSPRQRAVLGLLALHWTTGVPGTLSSTCCGVNARRAALWRKSRRTSADCDSSSIRSGPRGRGGPVMLAGRCYRLIYGIGLDLAEFGQLSRRADAASAGGIPPRVLSLRAIAWPLAG